MSFIVLEGTDGSGKSTQMNLLKAALPDFRHIDFPRYDKPSGALANLYLQGEYGAQADSVNPYAASMFFAVDRLASYLERGGWKEDYERGRLILADRFVSSNAIFQAAKLDEHQRLGFFGWLFGLEHDRVGLPRPDMTILLDMPGECAEQLMRSRNSGGDIHENDRAFQRRCRDTALLAAKTYDWTVIPCADGGEIRTAEAIHADVFAAVTGLSPRI
ncbi:thymidylate kinase [Clostridia bacterium]|nr:thymidylate kinase [Clostridia bacterium]